MLCHAVPCFAMLCHALLCMHIRVGFGWMRPKDEDPTLHSFRAGIKYFLLAPRGPLSSGVKSTSSTSSAADTTGVWAAALPTILVPRKRSVAPDEEAGMEALVTAPPLATTRRVTKKRRSATPINAPETSARFQERLLSEGCGTQVQPRPQRYVFPTYSSGHHYNPHTSCNHVGPF
jgi:hypothetical protein